MHFPRHRFPCEFYQCSVKATFSGRFLLILLLLFEGIFVLSSDMTSIDSFYVLIILIRIGRMQWWLIVNNFYELYMSYMRTVIMVFCARQLHMNRNTWKLIRNVPIDEYNLVELFVIIGCNNDDWKGKNCPLFRNSVISTFWWAENKNWNVVHLRLFWCVYCTIIGAFDLTIGNTLPIGQ